MAAQVNLAGPGGDPVRVAALRARGNCCRCSASADRRAEVRRRRGCGRRRRYGHHRRVARPARSPAARGAAVGGRCAWTNGRTRSSGWSPTPADSGRCSCSRRAPSRAASPIAGRRHASTSGSRCAPTRRRCRAKRIRSSCSAGSRPGRPPVTAQRELGDDGRRLESAYPMNRGRGVNVEPLGEVVLGRVRPTLYVLLGAVALVLLDRLRERRRPAGRARRRPGSRRSRSGRALGATPARVDPPVRHGRARAGGRVDRR